MDFPLHRRWHEMLFAIGMFSIANLTNSAIAAERDVVKTAVPVVLSGRLTMRDIDIVGSANGSAEIPIQVSQDWNQPRPEITRAIIIIHGWPRRDLGAADDIRKHAGALAEHTLFITAQFLIEADVRAHQLSASTLRWGMDTWIDGAAAQAPLPLSSFAVIDSIIRDLDERSKFPNLKNIVVAGHSAGGQFVQRYAVVGKAPQTLTNSAIHVRYVVANPASYLYFDERRQRDDGAFASIDPLQCPGFNDWRLGLAGRLPAYVAQSAISTQAAAALEQTYLTRDVVYLLGTADNDPHADALGQSCRYKIQGATRHARGVTYLRYLKLAAHGQLRQRQVDVPGVSHHASAMYASPCGLSMLFNTPVAGCQTNEFAGAETLQSD